MIDPHNITDFKRTQDQLEEFFIFSILVAGKTATTIAPRLEKILRHRQHYSPLSFMGGMPIDLLENTLHGNGIGCYRLKARAIWESARQLTSVHLRQGKPEVFEEIHGVGLKTSRFFIMHSRAGARVAALDTHILKGLKVWYNDAPKVTPGNSKVYKLWEDRFLAIADQFNITPAELDLMWWRLFSRSKPLAI